MPKVRRRLPVKKQTSYVVRTGKVRQKSLRRGVSVRKSTRLVSSGNTSVTFWTKVLQLLFASLMGMIVLIVVIFVILINQTEWNQKDQLTLLLIDRSQANTLQFPLHLLTISESDQDVAFLSLPPKLQLRALRQYGEFASDSLYSLYQQEKLPDRYVEGTLTYNLGVVIDHKMFIDQQIEDGRQLQNLFFASLFQLEGGTLKWGDRFHIWLLLARYGQVTDIGAKYELFDDVNSASSQIKPGVMETVVSKYFNRTQFLKSNWTIAVVNLTSETGVASFWGKRMKQTGFQLINVDSFAPNNNTQKSIIYLSQKAFEDVQVIKTLQALFPIELEFQVDAQVTQRFRSDVVVYISEDLVREYP